MIENGKKEKWNCQLFTNAIAKGENCNFFCIASIYYIYLDNWNTVTAHTCLKIIQMKEQKK